MVSDKLIILFSREEKNDMMTARVTNIRQDYDYTINDIALVNYVDNTIILVNKLGETFTYNSQDVVIAIAMQERKK